MNESALAVHAIDTEQAQRQSADVPVNLVERIEVYRGAPRRRGAVRPAGAHVDRALRHSIEIQNLTDAAAYDIFGAQRPGRAVYYKVVFEL